MTLPFITENADSESADIQIATITTTFDNSAQHQDHVLEIDAGANDYI